MAEDHLKRAVDIFVLIFAIVFFGTVVLQKIVPGLDMQVYADFYLAAILGLMVAIGDYVRRKRKIR